MKFRRGKPLEGDRVLGKARVHGVYGGSWRRARNRCRWVGVSEHAVVASVSVDRRGMMDQRRKHKSRGRVGYERQRREQEAKQRERKRGTVRGKRRARGLPVRGQQTSTNGKTARRLNRRYS